MNKDSADDATGPTPFQRFEQLTKRLLAVPKAEVKDTQKGQQPKATPKKRKPKNP